MKPDSPTFAELGARPETVEALAAVGIIALVRDPGVRASDRDLRGTDMIGQAPTGTGKTLGFGVPLLERVWLRAKAPTVARRPSSSYRPASWAFRSRAT